jgi:hypothetical protein
MLGFGSVVISKGTVGWRPYSKPIRRHSNLRGALREFLAESLDRIYLSQALGTLENVDFEFVLGAGIKLPI